MKTTESESIYDGASSWQERRAREKHQLAMQQAAASSQESLARGLAEISAKIDELVEVIRDWTLEVQPSSSDEVN